MYNKMEHREFSVDLYRFGYEAIDAVGAGVLLLS